MKRTGTILSLAALVALAGFAAGCSQQGGSSANTATSSTAPQNGSVVPAGLLSASPPPQPTGEAQANSWTIPHVLRMTDAAEDVETLNPMLTTDSSVTLILGPLSMGYLTRVGTDNQLIPDLCTQVPDKHNGGVSKDGLTITYHIRRGVRWSDGAPFNADDVVFSFEQVLNPNNNVASREGWNFITKIDEPDKYTVVLHLDKPYSPFAETWFSTAGANPALLPKHLLAGLPNLNHAAYNSKPVGLGPFMVKEWDRGTRVVLVRNPYYWRGVPKLKEIDYEIIPDVNTAVTEMQARSLDLAYQLPQNMYPITKTLEPFVNWAQPSYYFRHIDFNLTSPKLRDPIVRRALRLAIDRRHILDTLYHGIGHLQEQPAPVVAPYWDPKIRQVPFDIAKANQMLDADGWKRGPDGIREKNGVKLDLDFATASGTVINDQLIELVRQTWKQIGVAITVSHYQNTLLFAQYQDNGILYRGRFDVAYFAWGLDVVGDLSDLYACDQIPPNGQNILHWCNPIANRAMHELYADYDQRQRNADDATVMEQLDADVPTVVLMGTDALWVYNKDLRGFDPPAAAPFDNFMNVDI